MANDKANDNPNTEHNRVVIEETPIDDEERARRILEGQSHAHPRNIIPTGDELRFAIDLIQEQDVES